MVELIYSIILLIKSIVKFSLKFGLVYAQVLMWELINGWALLGVIIYVSFRNAITELCTAIESILIAVYWTITGFTSEFEIEDEDGNIIHRFPQINFPNN